MLAVKLKRFKDSAINFLYIYIFDVVTYSIGRILNLWLRKSKKPNSFQSDTLNQLAQISNSEQLLCKYPHKLGYILNRMTSDQLMIIIDFDLTITRYKDLSECANGERIHSCYQVMAAGCDEELPPESRIHAKLRQIHDKYYKFEQCSHLSSSEKQKLMEEWWLTSNNIIINAKLSADQLTRIVDKNAHKFVLREGIDELFELAKSYNFPVHVYSGGFDIFIRKALSNYKDQFGKTVFISANRFQFNKDNVLYRFEEPLIYGEKQGLRLQQLRNDVAWDRKDAIVIGDMVADSVMADGITCVENVIKIGVLNDFQKRTDTDSNVKRQYEENFDLVFCDENNINVVLAVLKYILFK
ncbi:hypothetical protein GJ496_001361 [Pomphorhynchus laevis]|nr:hypothetical protein GJ496_001361 [Pomphorhynchus laevis]